MPVKCFWVEPVVEAGQSRKWKRADTGEIIDENHHRLPVGAMWNATWLADHEDYRGPDGKSICVITPGGEWMIDGRASNCNSPCKNCGVAYKDHLDNDLAGHYYEDSRPHKCWIRHGIPPNLTVNKVGITCGAGAGSIIRGDYHGYLINGSLT